MGKRLAASRASSRGVGSESRDLYCRLLRAAVRSVALGDRAALVALAPRFRDVSATGRLWDEELYWSHRSPLLIAESLTAGEDVGALRLPVAFSERLRALGEAGRRRNARFVDESESVLSSLGSVAMPLKGTWLLERNVYPRAGRLFGDLDFAVEPETRRSDVVAALTDCGYEYRDMSTRRHLAFQRVVPGLTLYDGLPALREPLPNFGPHFERIQRTFFVEVHHEIDTSRSLRRPFVFRRDDRSDGAKQLLLLCHHLCKHEFAHAIGVVDIALMARSGLVDWARLASLCDEFGLVDICAAALGIAATCFGPDIAPAEADPIRRRRAFQLGAALGLEPILGPRATRQGRWLSVRLRKSIRATYRSSLQAVSPYMPRNFPLRWAYRQVRTAAVRRRSATYNER